VATASEFSRSYNSFSGVDIKATFGGQVIAELQAISYSITREKAPIYTMGSADPRSFARGKRGIAGTLIFVMFDRHALLHTLRDMLFQSDIDDIFPQFLGATTGELAAATAASNSARTAASPIAEQESAITLAQEDQANAMPWYTDQIPGFDITLAAANEYGSLAIMKVFGVEILNEGYGISIDDIVSEQQMTYIARTILPWQWVQPVYGPVAQAAALSRSGGG
jgi:hypothetical protein